MIDQPIAVSSFQWIGIRLPNHVGHYSDQWLTSANTNIENTGIAKTSIANTVVAYPAARPRCEGKSIAIEYYSMSKKKVTN